MTWSHLLRMCVTGLLTKIDKATRRKSEMYRALALGLSTQKIGLSSIFVVPGYSRYARWPVKFWHQNFPKIIFTPEPKPHVDVHVPQTLRDTHDLKLVNNHSTSLWLHSLSKHARDNELGRQPPPSLLTMPNHSHETLTFPNEVGSCFSFCLTP